MNSPIARRCTAIATLCALLSAPAQSQGILETVLGDSAGDRLGAGLGATGDFDQDGAADVIAGAPFDDNNGADSGSARVISGFTGAVLASFDGAAAGDQFGAAVSGAGDVNADGFVDLAIGAPFFDTVVPNEGRVTVISGQTGAVLFNASGGSQQFGRAVAAAGDVDLDGFDDVLVGQSVAMGSTAPAAVVLSGAGGAVLLSVLPGGGAVESVAGGVDWNADGALDLAVGTDQNTAFVFVTFPGGAAPSLVASGDSPSDLFGTSVALARDADGDGFAELIVGAPGDDDNGAECGSARVFRAPVGNVAYTVFGDAAGDSLGEAVAASNDVDGDGLSDFVAGAPGADVAGIVDAGRLRVYNGAGGAALYDVVGTAAGDGLGAAVAALGLVNGDTKADLAAAAPGDDSNGADAGRVFVLTGTCAAITEYGTGCPGTGPGVPDVDFQGCLSYGVQSTLSYTGGAPNCVALLFLGVQQIALPMGGGCTLLVGGILPVVLALPLSGAGSFGGPIGPPDVPPVNPYIPAKIYIQGFHQTSGSGDFANTRGECICVG